VPAIMSGAYSAIVQLNMAFLDFTLRQLIVIIFNELFCTLYMVCLELTELVVKDNGLEQLVSWKS